MSRNLLVALALAVLSLAVAAPAHAVLITVNFTVTGAGSDPAHVGEIAHGSFSFEKPSSPPPGFIPTLTSLDFSWDGTPWTDANASVGSVGFDASGDLAFWNLWGDVNGPGITDFPNDPDDFLIFSSGSFDYHNFGTLGIFGGPGLTSWSSTTNGAAPEPGTLALFAPGLLALGLVRRRKS